jgi:hypothetical protein
LQVGGDDRGDFIWDQRGTLEADVKRHEKQQASQRNNKPLTQITRCSCTMWGVGPKARLSWPDPPGTSSLIKGRDRQVIGFN